MAGFGHEDFKGRIPCPHCGSRDCAGIEWTGRKPGEGAPFLVCSKTVKRVSDTALVRSAVQHSLAPTGEEGTS